MVITITTLGLRWFKWGIILPIMHTPQFVGLSEICQFWSASRGMQMATALFSLSLQWITIFLAWVINNCKHLHIAGICSHEMERRTRFFFSCVHTKYYYYQHVTCKKRRWSRCIAVCGIFNKQFPEWITYFFLFYLQICETHSILFFIISFKKFIIFPCYIY